MRRRRLAAWCAAAALLCPALLGLCAFALPAQYGETFLGELGEKVELLEAPGGPRIVTLGGSGAAFGQDSGLLEELLPGYEAVNFGMYAGLGTSAMLELAAPRVREGDVVVISPEQSAQTLSGWFGSEFFWQAADGRWELLASLSPRRWPALAAQFGYFAGDKLRFVLRGESPRPQGIYARASFTGKGDVTAAGREENTMPGGVDPDQLLSFDPGLLDEGFVAELNAFAARCAARGARVYYRFCPMNAAALPPEEAERMDGYAQALAQALDFPILGTPQGAVMEPGWFFDTNFHLNASGAVVNTCALARELAQALGREAPELPELPDLPPLRDGGEQGGAWDPARCRGDETIREVVIPADVTRIPDGSFRGCTALERIVMENPDPAACPVGQGLLEGTDAWVYVPRGAYSAYLTNYFWAVHAQRIRPLEGEDGEGPGGASQGPEEDGEEPGGGTAGPCIRYDPNGGTPLAGAGEAATPLSRTHLRTNTALGQRLFAWEGHTLAGWNTEPDGTGRAVGFGSRVAAGEEGLTLYAQWVETAPEEEFAYELRDGEAVITAYLGEREVCAVPGTLGGAAVHAIASGAFAGAAVKRVFLPPGLFAVERGAFSGSGVEELSLYDDLYYIFDASFEGCEALRTLHIHAATRPVYSASYYAAFGDKYDRLLSLRGERKLALFSGSATRYGYDCALLREAFPQYEPVNMGVYAYTSALPQYRLILGAMEPGDVLLSAPEFDTVKTQFCVSNALDNHFWAMMEANYDAVAELDLREYGSVFDSLGGYLTARRVMEGRSYEVSPAAFDDDGNACREPTYNRYGDFVLPRPGAERDELLQTYRARYTVEAFQPETVEALNRVYREFREAGVEALFAYAPRNRSALTPDSTHQAREALAEYLEGALEAPVVLGMEESFYPATRFYLIDNHLSSEGVEIHTRRVIRGLRAHWEKG